MPDNMDLLFDYLFLAAVLIVGAFIIIAVWVTKRRTVHLTGKGNNKE
jgi:hypothetical protein